MTNGKFDEGTKELLKRQLGYDEDQIKIVEENPKQREIIVSIPILVSKKMIATCIQAEGCTYNKVGEQEALIQAGETEIDGALPVNTDGGCMA